MAVHKFVPVTLDLTDLQLKKLSAGLRVRISASQLQSGKADDVLLLTAVQANKIARAIVAKKGVELTLSQVQLAYIVKSGSGRFSDFFRSIGKAGVSVAKSGAKYLGNRVVDAAELIGDRGVAAGFDIAKSAAKGRIVDAVGQNIVSQGGDDLIQYGLDLGKRLTQSQLANLLAGVRKSINGKGLMTLSKKGAGLVLPGSTSGHGLILPGDRRLN